MSELPENSENPQKAVAQPPLVRLAFDALSDDISDRRGLKWEWTKVDEDVMEGEIRPAWEAIIATVLPKWEPIETAPKDGHAILALLRDGDLPHTIRWRADGWEIAWDQTRLWTHDQPTHWMPLPSLPNVTAQIPPDSGTKNHE